MARNRILVDTNFLYALFDEDDNKHAAAQEFIKTDAGVAIVPDVVLVEVVFLVDRAGGVPGAIRFFDSFTESPFQPEPITMPDLKSVREIVATYPRAHFDFVDCCLMALSERLNITQICTFDRRDFSIFRPKHTPYLELLP